MYCSRCGNFLIGEESSFLTTGKRYYSCNCGRFFEHSFCSISGVDRGLKEITQTEFLILTQEKEIKNG